MLALRMDQGRKFCNKAFDRFLNEHYIKRQTSTPYTPQQNRYIERDNCF